MLDTIRRGETGEATHAGFRLSPQQLAFFDAFGFLHLPGLFADETDRLIAGFEEIFASTPTWDTNTSLHFDQRRSIIPGFVSKSEKLAGLVTDPRVVSIVTSLLGPGYEYAESDGNLFYCDTSWHADTYSAPLDQLHVKLSFYLDPLSHESGAIRMIPGTNAYRGEFAETLRATLDDPTRIEAIYGVRPDEIPSWTLASRPGDLVVWNFRTIHASFNGGMRRRLFSLNFRQVRPGAEDPQRG